MSALPGAWYDLAARVSEADSVASCALEAASCMEGNYAKANHCGNLIAAVQDILRLMQMDVDKISAEMKA